MTPVPVRELRNHTRQVIDRVNAGETIVITVGGRPAIELRAIESRRATFDRAVFAERVLGHQADPGLTAELADLAPGTTDDLPL